MSREIIEALDKLDALFSGPEKWTQGVCARTEQGESVCVQHPDAACWCLFGAIWKVAGGLAEELRDIKNALAVGADPADWNDAPERTFADIKKLIADTRARLKAQP